MNLNKSVARGSNPGSFRSPETETGELCELWGTGVPNLLIGIVYIYINMSIKLLNEKPPI
jgi:hypothetical protein